MLTIATLTPQQGESYYQQENYYSQGSARSNSEWWGKGAATLGLSGQIADSEAYKNLINGFSPDGKEKLREKPKQSKIGQKQAKERAGVDLTFSAPKSVSLACLVGGDKRLEEAHRHAVKRTLAFIEGRYAQTRVKGQRVKTDNLTIAIWHHDTSRELDPHLHSHCVVMNVTQLSEEGTWQSRTDENLYYNKILLGRFYRNELALECQKLGYEIESHPQELFEIKGYSREQIEGFSKRHEQILNKLAEIGAEATTENKIWAWRKTRAKKKHEIDRAQMLPYWQEEADLYSIVHPVASPSPSLPSAEAIEAQLQAAVQAGIDHCSEREVAFPQEAIEKFISAEIRPFQLTEIEKAIEAHPDLLQTFDNRWTTQTAVARELRTIYLMQQGKGQVSAIAEPELLTNAWENKGFNQGQKEAVSLALTTSDRFIAWQGVAGAGKTYALNHFRQLAVTQGYVVKGFAPSAEAAKVLGEEVEIEANTVARLLCSQPPVQLQPHQIWIVDEAGLLSAKDALALLERATQEQARIIFVGDTRQLSAVEAGNPFKSLQQAGIATVHLNESRRQKPPDLQKAVNLAAAGEIAASLNHLVEVGRISEMTDTGERAAQIAQDYLSLTPDEREETLILAGTNAERLAITEQIRTGLKEERSLGQEIEAVKLKAKDLTQVQACYAHYFAVGDVVIPTREYKRQGLRKFQPYQVEAVNRDSLVLRDLEGNRLTLNPMKFRKSVYTRQRISIAVNEKLRWTMNERERERRNGQTFTVIELEGHTATICYQNGKTEQIDLKKPLYLDYALVSTTYSSQGKTAERVLISAAKDATVSQESFYVAISRAKNDLKLYAEDTTDLLERASQSKAKENPILLLQKSIKEELKLTSDNLETTGNLLRNNDELTEQPKSIDGANLGKRVSQRLNASGRETRPHREPAGHSVSSSRTTRPIPQTATNASEPRLASSLQRLRGVSQQCRTLSQNLGEAARGTQPIVKRDDSKNPDVRTPIVPTTAELQPLSHEFITVTEQLDGVSERIKTSFNENRAMETRPAARDTEIEATNQRINTSSRHLSQNVDTLTRRNALRRRGVEPANGQARASVRTHVPSVERTRQNLRALAEQVRSLPLEEIVQRLGLERDRYDKHKWESEAHIISINGQKFYDHLAQRGSGGAIDLVMHVKSCDFKDALAWLDGRSPSTLFERTPSPSPRTRSRIPKEPEKPPACNIRDESRWQDIKQYLTQKRGIPENLVESLHQQGLISADCRANVMFFRYGLEEGFNRGEAIGATLRGTEGQFKGLTPGTRRDEGFFWFESGQGKVKRVVLTESPIDAMSYASLNPLSDNQTTVYLSIDGAGSVPEQHLRQFLGKGGEVMVAYDSDRAGEEMAWKVARALPNVTRLKPIAAKDWNEILTQAQSDSSTDLSRWKRVAQAVGQSEIYLARIEAVKSESAKGQSLSPKALSAMQKDFHQYRQTQDTLWQWHEIAASLGKSQAYQQRIAEVATEFNASVPKPFSDKAIAAMKQDFGTYRQQQLNNLAPHVLWQKYSEGVTSNSPLGIKAIAQKALQDGCSPDVVAKLLQESPYFEEVQQQIGTDKTQQLIAGAVQAAQKETNQQKPPLSLSKSTQTNLEFEPY